MQEHLFGPCPTNSVAVSSPRLEIGALPAERESMGDAVAKPVDKTSTSSVDRRKFLKGAAAGAAGAARDRKSTRLNSSH